MVSRAPLRNPLQTPLTLIALPQELLITVALLLDLSTAISLSLVCRTLKPVAEVRIHQDLRINVGPLYGYDSSDDDEVPPQYRERSSKEKDQLLRVSRSDLRAAELRAKIGQIRIAGGTRRLGRVRRITLTSQLGAMEDMAKLLEEVSLRVESITVLGPDVSSHRQLDKLPRNADSLDVLAIRVGLSFPSLTHVRLRQNSIQYAEYLLHLCTHAPNLIDVDVDLSEASKVLDPSSESLPSVPDLVTDTKIRRLQAIAGVREDTGTVDAAGNPSDLAHPLLKVLARSPHLEELHVEYLEDLDSPSTDAILAETISRLEHLQALYWDIRPRWVFMRHTAERPGFRSLRKAVVYWEDCEDFFDGLNSVPIPALEAIYLTGFGPQFVPDTDCSANAVTMLPNIVQYIRGQSNLSVIHHHEGGFHSHTFKQIDSVEARGQYTGHIRSYKHGVQEIFHFRRLTHYPQVENTPLHMIFVPNLGDRITEYTAVGGEPRRVVHRFVDEAVWEDTTDLDGVVVPLEILEEMRVVEGAKMAEWRRRGVEVGDEAWAVLEEWMAHRQEVGV